MAIPVWFLASNFEPRGRSLYTLRLADHLPDEGFAPTILCASAERIPARYRDRLRIREVPYLTRPLLRTFSLRRLLQETEKERPSLIHAHRGSMAAAAMNLADRLDCRYILTIHDVLSAEQTLPVMPERLAAVIAVSPSVRRDLVFGAAVPAELVTVIPSGVDIPKMPKLPPPRMHDQIPVVGTAGALEASRGFTYFLMAAELILSSGHDVEFVVAGSGPEEETLRRIAQHLDIANRVTFVSHVTEYSKVLESIDLFVIPSLEQGLGTLMLEAMAVGKPVVASRVGGIADFFVDGEHALLVPRANPVALAEKIQYLLDNPEKARRLATAGQQHVRSQFSAERMAQETAKLYRSVLGSPAPSAGG